ncbi:hypothetical protein ES703_94937 [subsurface metagenome]
MKNIVNEIVFTFRMPKKIFDKIEEFAEKTELPFLSIRGGYKSYAIRLLIEDSLNRYLGPKEDPDQIICPFADEMSDIIPILKNIRLRGKLENITGDNKEEIEKIIKEFA